MNDENMAKATTPLTRTTSPTPGKYSTGLDERIGRYSWGKEVGPGITAIATPGHTPGHTSFAIASGNSR